MSSRVPAPRHVSLALLCLLGGCSLFPDVRHEPRYHNPFPQLKRVAVLPFYNQSDDPTINQDRVAIAYFNELQKLPGFEVMPVGVAKQMLLALNADPRSPAEFQQLARDMGVDAVVVGSVTDFSSYYPQRCGMSVDWYAANPGFHPIPPGYGLPWGTEAEKTISPDILFDAEFALAEEQLKTQTPAEPVGARAGTRSHLDDDARASGDTSSPARQAKGPQSPTPQWPDPSGFIPPSPQSQPPPLLPQNRPILSHTRLYNAHDPNFTERLADYYYFRDDARFGGWPGYLQRSEDFLRFCCHLHVTDMIAARGGMGKPRVVLRWPIDRYER